MYWDYPDVSPADRLAHASALDPDSVRLTPAQAFAKTDLSEPVTNASLAVFDGRPVYCFRSGRRDATVYADSGEVRGAITQEMMLRVASAWTGQAASPVTVESIDDVDQWTIQVRGLKPLWKYAWASGEHVYVSQASGEVVQYTTPASRLGAYLGPIPHWLYFTPLRKHGPLWSTLVIWLSALGTGTAILGIIIGISIFSPGRRYRIAGVPVRIPYSGAKRWHVVLGFIFGLAAATWAFSGMLSMGPFFWQGAGESRLGFEALSRRLRGNLRLAGFDSRSPRDALQLVGVKVRELELVDSRGDALLYCVRGSWRDPHRSARRAARIGIQSAAPARRGDGCDRTGCASGVRPHLSVRPVLPRQKTRTAVAGVPRPAGRYGAYALLHRCHDRSRGGKLQLPGLGGALDLSWPPFAQFSVVVRPSSALGHRRDHVHGWWSGAECDVGDPGMAGPREICYSTAVTIWRFRVVRSVRL